MPVIISLLSDPTDIVVQGEQTTFMSSPQNSVLSPVLQGQITTASMPELPIPSAMIGQHDWYGIKPRQIGPMALSTGEVAMLTVGKIATDVFVDPIQRWLSSAFQMDQTGFMFSLYDAKTIGAPEAFYEYMVPESETMGNPVTTIPRGAIFRSGLAKRITYPNLPSDFGNRAFDNFVETTVEWFITGITKDDAGAALGGCRVLLMESAKIALNPGIPGSPIVAEIVSDESGNFSFQVPPTQSYQLIAYKPGSTDVAGITRNDVLGVQGA